MKLVIVMSVRRKVAGKHCLEIRKHKVVKIVDHILSNPDVRKIDFGPAYHIGVKSSGHPVKFEEPDEHGVIKAFLEAEGTLQYIFIIPVNGVSSAKLKAELEEKCLAL